MKSRQDSRRRSRPEWVSKTDLIRYARCPYAFWLIDTGQVKASALLDEFTAQLIAEGVQFEESVLDEIEELPEEVDFETALTRERRLLGVPMLENDKLKIFGRPDGIDTQNGAMLPIEIKSHRDVHPYDKLELAFYWLLLEPYRTAPGLAWGILFLRRDEEVEDRHVYITPQTFREVRDLIEEVRQARTYGVTPRACSCVICRERPEVMSSALENDDVSLIWGVGGKRLRALKRMGITTLDDLLQHDPQAIFDGLGPRKGFATLRGVQAWHHHARACRENKPVVFGNDPFAYEEYIALDLEYSHSGNIWLTGVLIERNGQFEIFQLWSDDVNERHEQLIALRKICEEHSDLPILTWSGEGADLPQLSQAATTTKVALMKAIRKRHFDVYEYTRDNVRFPIPRLGLKEIGEHLNVPRDSAIRGGLEANMLYRQYTRADGKERSALRAALLEYNADDLRALRMVTIYLRKIRQNEIS